MGKVFQDSQALYDRMRPLFERVVADPTAAEKLAQSRLIVRFRFRDPEGQILLNGRKNPAEVMVGEEGPVAEVEVTLMADTADAVFLGNKSLGAAYTSGEITARGGMLKLFSLKPLLEAAERLYTSTE